MNSIPPPFSFFPFFFLFLFPRSGAVPGEGMEGFARAPAGCGIPLGHLHSARVCHSSPSRKSTAHTGPEVKPPAPFRSFVKSEGRLDEQSKDCHVHNRSDLAALSPPCMKMRLTKSVNVQIAKPHRVNRGPLSLRFLGTPAADNKGKEAQLKHTRHY